MLNTWTRNGDSTKRVWKEEVDKNKRLCFESWVSLSLDSLEDNNTLIVLIMYHAKEDGSCDLNVGDSDVIMMSMYFGLVERECSGVGARRSIDSADSAIVDCSC